MDMPKHPVDAPAHAGLRVASYNVHKCVGTDGRFDPARTSQVIQELDADVVALQEADRRFGDRAGLLDLAQLQRDSGLELVPAAAQAQSHGWRGNVLLFRRGAVRQVQQIALPGLEPRGAVVVEIGLEAGRAIRVIAAHFGLLRSSRRQQARAISALAGADMPTLLMGDLNEWRQRGRSPFGDLGAAFAQIPAGIPSFPSRRPLLALDRIIASRRGLLSAVAVHDTPLARIASDHLPIRAVVDLPPA